MRQLIKRLRYFQRHNKQSYGKPKYGVAKTFDARNLFTSPTEFASRSNTFFYQFLSNHFLEVQSLKSKVEGRTSWSADSNVMNFRLSTFDFGLLTFDFPLSVLCFRQHEHLNRRLTVMLTQQLDLFAFPCCIQNR